MPMSKLPCAKPRAGLKALKRVSAVELQFWLFCFSLVLPIETSEVVFPGPDGLKQFTFPADFGHQPRAGAKWPTGLVHPGLGIDPSELYRSTINRPFGDGLGILGHILGLVC
jgi:hypothetical protein